MTLIPVKITGTTIIARITIKITIPAEITSRMTLIPVKIARTTIIAVVAAVSYVSVAARGSGFAILKTGNSQRNLAVFVNSLDDYFKSIALFKNIFNCIDTLAVCKIANL